MSGPAAPPLAGMSVGVTRARTQASALAGALQKAGAEVVEAPVIRIDAIDGPAPDIGRYDLVCLTSANGARALLARLHEAGRDGRALARAHVAAVGPGTAAALAEQGVVADVIPERSVAEGLVDALAGIEVHRALIARARHARDVLPDALRQRGVEVDVLPVYETVAIDLSAEQIDAIASTDYLTFTSSSTVTNLLRAAGGEMPAGPRLASIGPVTSTTLRRHGLTVDLEAASHDIPGLVDAIVADVTARGARGGDR